MTCLNNEIDDMAQKILKIGRLLGLKEEDIQVIKKTTVNNEKLIINCPAHAYNNSAGLYGSISIRGF